ncbi:MAG TPA: gluconokinase, partial [Armatimonadota bacterium]|nr:gluconokinase [Armatimonadota bacterium]
MIILLMGVAGSGKTTVGRLLAAELDWAFFDADDLHPPVNIAKMARGDALTDADRGPWLDAIHALLRSLRASDTPAVIACSALKAAYRARLLRGITDARLVYLKGDPALIRPRMASREGHYMPVSLLDSQFAALEEPDDALVIDA